LVKYLDLGIPRTSVQEAHTVAMMAVSYVIRAGGQLALVGWRKNVVGMLNE